MININNVSLVGRLTKDPELRKTQSNTSVCGFTLACNRDFVSEGGQEADFINCIAWRQSADFLTKYARKGDYVGVRGRIQTRSYENESNKKVYVTEVLVEHLCIDTKREASKEDNSQVPEASIPQYDMDNDGGFSNTPSLDISSDDLPFY